MPLALAACGNGSGVGWEALGSSGPGKRRASRRLLAARLAPIWLPEPLGAGLLKCAQSFKYVTFVVFLVSPPGFEPGTY
jgi:hypothetical protein